MIASIESSTVMVHLPRELVGEVGGGVEGAVVIESDGIVESNERGK
jgi:hypothetical protein